MALDLIQLGADVGDGRVRVVQMALLDLAARREVLVVVESFDWAKTRGLACSTWVEEEREGDRRIVVSFEMTCM